MSPEAIENPDGMRRFKVGRASDVWSLGCILYQMIYGHPPFHYCNAVIQKMKSISDPNVVINFPTYIEQTVEPSDAKLQADQSTMDGRFQVPETVINIMKRCLLRNPKERATIPELLAEPWLSMSECEWVLYVSPVHCLTRGSSVAGTSAAAPPTTAAPAPTPSVSSLLKDDEAVVTAHLVKQLLNFAVEYHESGHTFDEATALVCLTLSSLVSETHSCV